MSDHTPMPFPLTQAAIFLVRPHFSAFPFDPGGSFPLPGHTPRASSLTQAAFFLVRPHSHSFPFDPTSAFFPPDHKKDALRAPLSFYYISHLILPAHFSLHPQRITIQFFRIEIHAVHIHRIPLWIFICRIIIDPL